MLFSTILFASTTLASNILVATTDTWVSKNVRHLQDALEKEAHNVILVGPLYDSVSQANNISVDGGEFGHLLPANIQYYLNLKSLKLAKRGAKGVIHQQFNQGEKDIEYADRISEAYHGQDPLNDNAWYVNDGSLETIQYAIEKILPTYYSDITIDLVIIGPNEGSHLTKSTEKELKDMLNYVMRSDIPVIAASTEDSESVYYNSETYFSKGRFGKNIYTKSIKFFNRRIIKLINTLSELAAQDGTHRLLPSETSLNINFPSIYHQHSHCEISRKHSHSNPQFEQVVFADNTIETDYKEEQDQEEYPDNIDKNTGTFIDRESNYFKYKMKNDPKYRNHPYQDYSDNKDLNKLIKLDNLERLALDECKISVVVNNLHGDGLGANYFSIY